MKTPLRLCRGSIGLVFVSLAMGCGVEPDASPPDAVSRAPEGSPPTSPPTSPPGVRPSQGTPLWQDPRIMPAISLVDERPEGFEAVKQRFPLIHVHYGDRPNLLLGIEGGFTDDELIAGLRHFYENWQASVDFPDSPPPDLILAQQNWGAGTSIWEALEELAGQHGIRIWRIYPVVTGFQIEQDRHPLAVDRELHDSIVAMANPPVTAVTVGD